MSLVSVARLTNGRPCSRLRTKSAAAIEPCGQISFIGSAILRGTSSTRAMAAHIRQHDERAWRTVRAAPPSSSTLRSCTRRRCSIDGASPGRGCGQWTVLLLSCATHRLFANRIRAHRIRYSLSRPCMSTKSNRFVARLTKKMRARRNAMHRCHRKPPRQRCHGGLSSVCDLLSRACRSARMVRSRGPCSWRLDGSVCCRRAVP